MQPTAAQLTPLLAGTQCTQCGYPSCAAYAEAVAENTAPTNLCRPGGARVAQALATALNKPYAVPAETPLPPQIAYINEPDCIGCTLCLQKCPTSAIVGAPSSSTPSSPIYAMAVISASPVCPTNCITLQPAPSKHTLTQQLPGGSLTEQASKQIWNLVHAIESRQQTPTTRTTIATPTTATTRLSDMPPEILAKIAAARSKSEEKFAAKGPIRTPRALKLKK